MGKGKNAAKGIDKAPNSHFPILSSHVGEAEDPCNGVQESKDGLHC